MNIQRTERGKIDRENGINTIKNDQKNEGKMREQKIEDKCGSIMACIKLNTTKVKELLYDGTLDLMASTNVL